MLVRVSLDHQQLDGEARFAAELSHGLAFVEGEAVPANRVIIQVDGEIPVAVIDPRGGLSQAEKAEQGQGQCQGHPGFHDAFILGGRGMKELVLSI